MIQIAAWLSLPWIAFHCKRWAVRGHRSLATIVWVVFLTALVTLPVATAVCVVGPHAAHHLALQSGAAFTLATVGAPVPPPHSPAAGAQEHPGSNPVVDILRSFLPFGISESVTEARCQRDAEGQWLLGNHPAASKAEMTQLNQVVHSLKHCFAYSNAELPGYSGALGPVRIELIHQDPIFQAARKYSALELDIIQEKCTDLYSSDIIGETSMGAFLKYASNCTLPVKKDSDGAYTDKRFCLDFVAMNAATLPDLYPTPLPEDIFSKAAGCAVFSKLDMRAGYFQLPIAKESRSITSFWWGKRLFHFKRLPMGLKNATAAFQRVMDHELRSGGCQEFAAAFVDDVLIFSPDFKSHVQHVRQVLETLHAVGLRAHPAKSVFATDIVEYLGHNISATGLSPMQAKVASIRDMPEPRNVSELRAHLGFLNYYRCYLPDYAALCRPLNDMLRKDCNWDKDWGAAQRAAFTQLKDAMCTPGIGLRHPDPSLPFELHTDWSVKGVSAILLQRGPDSQPRLIACCSRSLNEHERRYSSWQGELLAAVYGVRMYRQYLHGRRFVLKTDHRPLLWLLTCKALSSQHTRWLIMLQDYDFEVHHVAGKEHVTADVPSRFPSLSTADPTAAKIDPDGPIVRHSLPKVFGPDGMQLDPEQLEHEAALVDASMFKAVHRSAPATLVAHLPPCPDWLDDDVTARSPADLSTCDQHRPIVANTYQQQGIWQLARQWVRHSQHSIPRTTAYLPGHHAGDPDPAGCRTTLQLCTKDVSDNFYTRAFSTGVILYEPFGGSCNGLLSALRCGVKIQRYIYSDTCPTAQACARHRTALLSARYPDQFPASALSSSFSTLPMDVYNVNSTHLSDLSRQHSGVPWMVIGGWECQDLSPAGQGAGISGARSKSFFAILRILGALQQLQPDYPPGYVIENTAFQHNWKHAEVAQHEFSNICRMIGTPVLLDAARVGSSAHRLRNFWTNLHAPEVLQHTLDQVDLGPFAAIRKIIPMGWELAPVTRDDRLPYYPVNVVGQPREAWPTFVSYHASRAFLPGKAGSIYTTDATGQIQWAEPSADMREEAMGMEEGATSAPGLTELQRRDLLGRAIDPYALQAILSVAHAWWQSTRPTPVTMCAAPPSLRDPQLQAISNAHLIACTAVAEAVDNSTGESDIMTDSATLAVLRGADINSYDTVERCRIRKRLRLYRYRNDTVWRLMPDASERVVPPLEERLPLVQTLHDAGGHFGVQRSADLVLTKYWWRGLYNDVRTVVQHCVPCQRSLSTFGKEPAQLHPLPIEGLFYRWGCDLFGPLPPTTAGNRYVLVAIEHFSKTIELVPLPDKQALTTATAFHLHVIGRYGACGEVLTDQGSEWNSHFHDMLVRCKITHRRASAHHPQSDGLTERCVQTVKTALRKLAHEYSKDAPTGTIPWDLMLPTVGLGYRCSRQASTGFSPYQLLYGVAPTIPPSVKEIMHQDLDYLNPAACAESLIARSSAMYQDCITAGNNLRIAQQRDRLRYMRLHDGTYHRPAGSFFAGQYVYIQQTPHDALQFTAGSTILRVREVRPTGVLRLEGRCGRLVDVHMSWCAPCHLPVDSSIDVTLQDVDPDLPCVKCERSEIRRGNAMLLCDNCNAGWHQQCLQPPLPTIPAGAWLCPECLHKGLTLADVTSKLQRAKQQDASESTAHPAPATKRRDEAAAKLHGRFVSTSSHDPSSRHQRWGRVEFQGVTTRPSYFVIRWQDGTIQPAVTPTWISDNTTIQPEGVRPPRYFLGTPLPACPV